MFWGFILYVFTKTAVTKNTNYKIRGNFERSDNAKHNIGTHPQALVGNFETIIDHKNSTITSTVSEINKLSLPARFLGLMTFLVCR